MGTYILFSQVVVLLGVSQDDVLDFLELVLGQDLEYFILRVLLEYYFADEDVRVVVLVDQVRDVDVIIF